MRPPSASAPPSPPRFWSGHRHPFGAGVPARRRSLVLRWRLRGPVRLRARRPGPPVLQLAARQRSPATSARRRSVPSWSRSTSPRCSPRTWRPVSAFSNTVQGLSLPSEGMTINIPAAPPRPVLPSSRPRPTRCRRRTSRRDHAGGVRQDLRWSADISRQAVERGRGADQIIYADGRAVRGCAEHRQHHRDPGGVRHRFGGLPPAPPTVAELFPCWRTPCRRSTRAGTCLPR